MKSDFCRVEDIQEPETSASFDLIGDLIRAGLLAPPARPGVAATLGRFEVVGVLGEGGMGVVLEARDSRTGTAVAIKLLKPHLVGDAQAVHRFVREARLMQGLDHPHILRAQEVLETPQGPYFVMPLLRMGSLSKRLRPRVPLEERAILAFARQVAAALAYAHKKGLIHRDLKPGNVLLDDNQQAFLTDFGLARSSWSNDSLLDVARPHYVGTAAYMPPAVAAGEAEDTRGDIYSFGATLYQLLTGQPPYAGATSWAVLECVRAGPPVPILQRNPQAPRGLVRIAEGAMAREVRDRYASMTDVLADLERVAGGEIPMGPHGRVSASGRSSWRWRRRSTRAAVSLGLLTLLLVLGWRFWPQQDLAHQSPGPESQPRPTLGPLLHSMVIKHTDNHGEWTSAFEPKHGCEVVCCEDGVRLRMKFSTPSYCQLIAFNPPNGTMQRCYPNEMQPPPGPATTVDFPFDKTKQFQLTDGPGMQAFVLVVSRERQLPVEDPPESLRAGWEKSPINCLWIYNEDGYNPHSIRRGLERPWPDSPSPFVRVCDFFKGQPGIEAVFGVAFPVRKAP